MATRTVSVKLQAEVGQFVSGMGQAAAATKGLDAAVDSQAKNLNAHGKNVEAAGAKTSAFGRATSGAMGEVSNATGLASVGFGGLALGAGALAGGFGLAISKSMQFEKSMSAVQAATQASAGTMEDLRKAAIKAGADTQYSATEAADAITEMSKAGVSAKDIMGGGLSGALNLAAAGQLDVADAAGIASVAMTQFNLSGSDLPHVADLLAAGAGKAMGSVEDLGQALNQAGLVASAAGLTIEDTTGTLAAFAAAGLTGSDAGTSFKTMLQMLQAPTEKAAGLMQDLGLNMYDSQGHMLGMSQIAGQLHDKLSGLTDEQRNSALATIFGSDAVRAANVLYADGAKGISDWTKKVNDQGYAQKQAAELTDNLSGDIERLGGSFDTLMISLGSGSQGPLRETVQGLTDLVNAANAAIGPISDIAHATQGWEVKGNKSGSEALHELSDWLGHSSDKSKDAKKSTDDLKASQDAGTASMYAAASSAASAADQTETLAQQLQDTADSANAAGKQVDLLKTSLDVLTGAHISLIQAQSAVYDATAAATNAMKANGGAVLDAAGALNVHSENGRKAQDVLVGVADKSNQLISTMIQQGATSDQVTAKDAELRKSFIDTATQMGISRQHAEELANQIYGIPDQRTTTIKADTTQAAAAVGNLQGQLDQLVKDRTASINFRATLPDLNGSASGSGRPGMATGGYVRGAGTSTSDSIPVNLSNGEYVVKASTVRAVGVDNLDALNQGRMGYASGGLVTLNARADTSGALSGLGSFANRLSSAVSGAVQSGLGAAVAAPGGSVERWRPIVLQVLSMLGISPTAANGVLSLIKSESGGNPTAINLTDSNARAGHPSQGLMQTIPATFARWAGPYAGRGITDPLANIYAGVNYALHTYGVGMLTGGGRHNSSGSYVGYAGGGGTPAGSPFWVGENGPELMWSSKEHYVSTAAQSREVSGSSGGGGVATMAPPNVTVQARVFVGDREITDIVRVESSAVIDQALTAAVTGANRR